LTPEEEQDSPTPLGSASTPKPTIVKIASGDGSAYKKAIAGKKRGNK
jgi:hypothetical protein